MTESRYGQGGPNYSSGGSSAYDRRTAQLLEDMANAINKLNDSITQTTQNVQQLTNERNALVQSLQNSSKAYVDSRKAVEDANIARKKEIKRIEEYLGKSGTQAKLARSSYEESLDALADKKGITPSARRKERRRLKKIYDSEIERIQNEYQAKLQQAEDTFANAVAQPQKVITDHLNRARQEAELRRQIAQGKADITQYQQAIPTTQQAYEQKIANRTEDDLARRSSKLYASMFRGQPWMKTGQIPQAVEVGAKAVQAQDKFISKLVQAFAPLINKGAKIAGQFGKMVLLKGISDIMSGNLGGIGEAIIGGLLTAMPMLLSAFGSILGILFQGIVLKRAITQAIGSMAGGTVASATGSAVGGAVASGTASTGGGGIIGWFLRTLLPALGQVAIIATAVALIAGTIWLIAKNLDKIVDFFTRVTSVFSNLGKWIKKKLGIKDEPDGASELATSSVPHVVDTTGHAEGANYVFGTRVGEGNKIGLKGGAGRYTRAQIQALINNGTIQAENLKGGKGWVIDGQRRDIAAARTGTSAIISAVAQKMGTRLTVSSGMGTINSIHDKKRQGFGHYEGQTLDFAAGAMTREQAINFARRMYATGYFSHVAAELGSDGKYHIDARISNKSYEALNQIQQQNAKQQEVTKPTPAKQQQNIKAQQMSSGGYSNPYTIQETALQSTKNILTGQNIIGGYTPIPR